MDIVIIVLLVLVGVFLFFILGGYFLLEFLYELFFKTVIGWGMRISWEEERDGKFFVLVRLIKGPAGRAGILAGDEILEINGVPILPASSKEDAIRVLESIPKAPKIGEVESIKILRDGKEHTFTMKARIIWRGVPYHYPHGDLPHYLYKTWPMQDPRTGQLYVKAWYSPAF